MSQKTTRRGFIKTAGLVVAGERSMIAMADQTSVRTASGPSRCLNNVAGHLRIKEIENEIERRANRYLSQKHLVVDYYRIGRTVAYPLPIKSTSIPEFPVPDIDNYPWATWMTWELEERVNCLGWVGEWLNRDGARKAVSLDLAALADWPSYRQYNSPDLCLGHAARILCLSYRRWNWLGVDLKQKIRDAFRRIVADVYPLFLEKYGVYCRKEDLLNAENPNRIVHNIPMIGSFGLAFAATMIDNSPVAEINERLLVLLEALFELRKDGHSEAVAYDGYMLDFVADWLSILSEEQRESVLRNSQLKGYLEESYMLGAPGNAAEVAELSDVEPKEMPFHISAQAKLQTLAPDPVRAWHLTRWRIDWMRADCLAALHFMAGSLNGEIPPAGALDAQYAGVLRTGWQSDDLAVAVSYAKSPLSHTHYDGGSLVIGTEGCWFITDPGYQQYMKDAEREFTLGITAHNAPVINGNAQSKKAGRLLRLTNHEEDLLECVVDITNNYDAKCTVTSAVRTVILVKNKGVAVADRVRGTNIENITYHWHGHKDAAWWVENGWAMLLLGRRTLWFGSPQARVPITTADITRLPGSRGQLTLTADVRLDGPVIWWLFAFAESPPAYEISERAETISFLGQTLTAS
ncbi:MAG: heparinase II/III family protein [bacterium]